MSDEVSPQLSSQPQNSPLAPQKATKKSGGFPWFTFSLILAGLLAVLLGGLKYYYSFGILDHNYYKPVFYSWRVLHADKLMYSTAWSRIHDNRYNEKTLDGKLKPFIKDIAQEGKTLLYDGHPEHFPRSAKLYFTHGLKPFNEDFLEFRKLMVLQNNKPLAQDILDKKRELTTKDYKYWISEPPIEVKKNIYTAENLSTDNPISRIYLFMQNFTIFLLRLHEGFYKEKVGEQVPDSLYNDMKFLLNQTRLEDKEDSLKKTPRAMGRALGSVHECFGYSRLFYLLYFSTIKANLNIFTELKPAEGLTEKETKAREKKINDLKNDYSKKSLRMKIVAKCFSILMMNIYEGDYEAYKGKQSSLDKFLFGIFGPKIASDPKDVENENINNLLNELKDVYEIRNTDSFVSAAA